jgi:hypothetical protein
MKPDKQRGQLLDDILLDEELTGFKEELLNQCLGELKRRRKRQYYLYTVVAVAAVLLIVSILRFDTHTAPTGPADRLDAPSYVVRTTALTEQQIARTAVSCEIVHTQNDSCVVYNTAIEPGLMVQTHYELTRLNDSEMLKLFDGVSCGIIRPQGAQSRFVFFNPKDTQRFFGTP